MPPVQLPPELIHRILKVNLDPCNRRLRTDSLLAYSLLNNAFREIYHPLLFQHLDIHGDKSRISTQLQRLRNALLAGGKDLRNGVRILSCRLPELKRYYRESETRMALELVALCPRLDEFALDGLSEVNLVELLAGASQLRVVHLANLSVQMYNGGVVATSSLRHLAVSHCNIPTPPPGLLRNIESISDSTGALDMGSLFKQELPHLHSLRLRYNTLRRRFQWPSSVTSLEIIDNQSLRRTRFPLNQLLQLSTAVSTDDLVYLLAIINHNDTPLCALRLIEAPKACDKVKDFEAGRAILISACDLHNIALSFHREATTSVQQFWNEAAWREALSFKEFKA